MVGTVQATGPQTLHLPRILCLHGAGVNAHVFKLQMRVVCAHLEKYFRLVFVDGPFVNDMHPDLYPVYSDMGPYRSWTRWLPHQETAPVDRTIDMIEKSLMDTMAADQGTGEWVGILGFSQGAKVSFSILVENQLRRRRNGKATPFAGVDFKFGIILAGRAPAYALNKTTLDDPRFIRPGDISSSGHWPADAFVDDGAFEKLTTPTLHVHGMHDQGLELHRELHRDWPAPYSDQLVEWEGAHRIPFKSWDVKAVVNGLMRVAMVGRQ